MELRTNSQNDCPMADICGVIAPESEVCELDTSQFPPLPIGELLCGRALIGAAQAMAIKNAKTDPIQLPSHNLVAAGWLNLESVLAAPIAAGATSRAQIAVVYADNVLASPYSSFKEVHSAAMLRLYAPLLVSRKDTPPQPQTVNNIWQMLGAMYSATVAAPLHKEPADHILDAKREGREHLPCFENEDDRLDLIARQVGMMLMIRNGKLVYASSEREASPGGNFAHLDHNAYVLTGTDKTPIKFRVTSNDGVSTASLPVRGVSIRPALLDSVSVMRSKRRQHYAAVRKRGRKAPNIIDVGGMLQREAHDDINASERVLLDMAGIRLDRLLRGLPVATKDPAWDVLPTDVIRTHETDMRSVKGGRLTSQAYDAVKKYREYGHGEVERMKLKQLIQHMRQVNHAQVTATCIGAYIDLARNQHTQSDKEITEYINAAEVLACALSKKNWRNLDPRDVSSQLYAKLQLTYIEKYKKSLTGQQITIDDETQLYAKLLELGRYTLEPGQDVFDTKGIQFEIGLHILNARYNVRHNQVSQSLWHSRPREDSPHDGNFEVSTGWDVAVSRGDFLHQGPGCRYVQCKSVERGKKYHPKIIVIAARDDFSLKTNYDLIDYAIKEAGADNPLHEAGSTAQLNRCEQIFLNKLGYDKPSD